MLSKVSILSKLIILGMATLLALSGQAMASTTNWGAQTVPSSINFGASFLAPQNQFYDDYLFSIPTASVDSISSTISLGSYLGINNLQTRLYSGTLTTTGVPSGLLQAWSTAIPISQAGLNGTVAVINPITLSSGSYILEVRGDAVGTAGGSYAGTLNISPVPEVAPWVMLLIGLLMTSLAIARRNQNSRIQFLINREGARVIDTYIDALSWGETLTRIATWARERESRYVCICNVHSVMTASHDAEFKKVLDLADMATPDGMPVAWMLSRQGFVDQERINGPDLMWKYCALASRSGESVYFYGSTDKTLHLLIARLQNEFPGLEVGGAFSPPFRVLSKEEDEAIIASINNSGAGVVFVSLGCPKQEKWMEAHRHRIHAVMIGVGAAFDYHAGTLQRAPLWMQNCGLEWLHRLCSEPRRLWKRYLVTNTLFILGAGRQLLHVWGIMPLAGNNGFSRSSRVI